MTARIVREEDTVVWDDFRHTSDSVAPTRSLGEVAFTFDAASYDAAVMDQGQPTPWTPTTRQAAISANTLIRSFDLGRHGLRHVSASHRGSDEVVVEAITVPDAARVTTCLDVVVRRHEGEAAAELADRIVEYVESGRFLAEAEVGSTFGPRSAT